MTDNKKLFSIVDVLASEYGWSLEYCLSLPSDVVIGLLNAIRHRKGTYAKLWTKLIGAACAAGFAGKLDRLDKIFTDTEGSTPEVDKAAWKGQIKSMWMKVRTKGKKNLSAEEYKTLSKKFEDQWASGKDVKF